MSALPPLPAGVRKAVVAYVDVHFGSHMAAALIRQGVEVSGILHDAANANSVVAGLKRVVLRNNAEAVRKVLLDADYVVYQMVDSAQDAISAIKLLYTTHCDVDKRFVLVSSLLTWAETPPLAEPAPPAEDEVPELEALTEDQYNRRIPHVKYLAWREAEKLVAASNNDRLKTSVVFSGLPYGRGEALLHPLLKQAWSLAPEGLPIFGNGRQVIPMIHVTDLVRVVSKLFAVEEIPELRYYFAVDDGNCTWNDIIKSLNTSLGNGKTFRVPQQELCLYDNVEQFLVNLKLDAQQIQAFMTEEDWTCKSGFVENIETIVAQYREDRGVTPLRVVMVGPPQSGKSFTARELAEAYRMPSFDLLDIITEYKYQETELKEELARIREERVAKKIAEKLDERRQTIVEERKTAKEAALAEKAEDGVEDDANADQDDIDEEDEIDVHLTAEEEKEIRDAVAEDNDDERIPLINEKLDEVKKVLAMRVKPQVDASLEPVNPKDKKKAPPPKKDPKKPVVEETEEPPKDARFSDRALALMTRWKLSRMQCRNQGYVLDGFPKTIKQARLIFEDTPIDLPDDGEDADAPLDEEVKPCNDKLFPTFVVHVKAPDAFLLDRLQRTQAEHPHNNPEDFMRRLDFYKQHYDVAYSVLSWLESARSANGKACTVRSVDMDQCPLVVPALTRSVNAPKVVDQTILKIIEIIGKPHNFGPTPQDAHRELMRQRTLAEEQANEQEALVRRKKDKELVDVAAAQKLLQEQRAAAAKVKESERKMLEARKAPLKAYLMQQVIPVLTKGLIEVCNRKPEDPIDFLAEWLFRHNPEDDDTVYQ